MKKHTKIILLTVTSVVALFSTEGCTIKSKEQTRQAQSAISSSTKGDKEAIKQKQLGYLKEHEQEIVDFVKAQNSKVESVQIEGSYTME